jgi:hypothetical protein
VNGEDQEILVPCFDKLKNVFYVFTIVHFSMNEISTQIVSRERNVTACFISIKHFTTANSNKLEDIILDAICCTVWEPQVRFVAFCGACSLL